MDASRVLVLYDTVDGQTRKIAERIAEALRGSSVEAAALKVGRVPGPLDADGLRGVIVCGPVRFGRHPRRLRKFVQGHREELDAVPSAFVSVCGAAANQDPESRKEAEGYVRRFVDETGWSPDRTVSVAGTIAYTRYNPILRWVMKRIAMKTGGPTDTSRDHELTDWEAVDRFTGEFVDRLGARAAEV